MKIADVAEFYSPRGGGVRTYVHEKLRAGARLGHEVVVIAPGPADAEEQVDGGKIITVKAPVLPVDRRYHIFAGAEAVHRVLDREKPDVVEGSSPWRGGWIASSWRGAAIKSLVMHADPVASYPHTVLGGVLPRDWIDGLFGWFWWYLRRLNQRFDTTIVSGQWLARRFESFGLQRIEAIPFGVDRALFNPATRLDSMRQAMLAACRLADNGRVLICVGRHHPEKRLPMLIAAVERANRTCPPESQIGLYIVGDGISRATVERSAAAAAHIHVAGQVADRRMVARLTASADALIHGCGSETYGLAVAEALCCGTPVIVPDTGGTSDLAAPAYSEKYAVGNGRAAAVAIERLLGRDRKKLSEAALTAADVRVGSATSHFERLFALYQTLEHDRIRLNQPDP